MSQSEEIKNHPQPFRRQLAQKLAEGLAEIGEIESVLLIGSVARGNAKESSDLDLVVAYRQPLREAGGGLHGGTAETGFGVYHFIEGVKVDFAHFPCAATEFFITAMQQQFDPAQLPFLVSFAEGIPLYGAPWVRRWQREALKAWSAYLSQEITTLQS